VSEIRIENMPAEQYPCLKLTFAKEGAQLVDASFSFETFKAPSRKLITEWRKGKSFRAICILLLLAKYQGESFVEEGKISFFASDDRPTWIKTLGTSFGKRAQESFFETYFHGRRFVSVTRGSRHTVRNKKGAEGAFPVAKYHTSQLRLENLRFFRRTGESGDKSAEMTQEELAHFAKNLEMHEVGKRDGWVAIVPGIVRRTNQDRPRKPHAAAEEPNSETDQEGQPFILRPRWLELLDSVREETHARSSKEADGANWYVVCIYPSWLLDWKSIFRDAITRHKAKIRFAYHSPTAAENCPAVSAQWRMHARRAKKEHESGVDFVRDRIRDLKREMRSWAAEVKPNGRAGSAARGGFEFYESRITHPYLAIMSVPQTATRGSTKGSAPEGTWCVAQLYLLYPTGLDERCGLYLKRPSPMLDLYYNSILTFFEQGPKDGYLDWVDLLSE
jgi:hypothetical protein